MPATRMPAGLSWSGGAAGEAPLNAGLRNALINTDAPVVARRLRRFMGAPEYECDA
jgi:hypothetical protein